MDVPESREVWEHSKREFDRRDALLGFWSKVVLAAAAALLVAVWVLG